MKDKVLRLEINQNKKSFVKAEMQKNDERHIDSNEVAEEKKKSGSSSESSVVANPSTVAVIQSKPEKKKKAEPVVLVDYLNLSGQNLPNVMLK